MGNAGRDVMVREIALEHELDLILGVGEPIEVEWSSAADPELDGPEGTSGSPDDDEDDDWFDDEE
jgi:hypothetical protein